MLMMRFFSVRCLSCEWPEEGVAVHDRECMAAPAARRSSLLDQFPGCCPIDQGQRSEYAPQLFPLQSPPPNPSALNGLSGGDVRLKVGAAQVTVGQTQTA